MLRYKVRVRKGKWADSPQNPDRKQPRKMRDDRPKRERKVTDLTGVLRRQIAEEVGESELTKDQRFALLQKYGTVAPIIDRKVTKPSWMGEKQWNQMQNEWYKATKGLVPQAQLKSRRPSSVNSQTTTPRQPQSATAAKTRTKPWSQIKHKRGNSQQHRTSLRQG